MYQRGVPPQATYTFKHALIQDAAYQSLLRSTRQQYHQRLAQVLAEQFPETAETQPELLAHHYTEAGLSEPAVAYWQQAGQRAAERSALWGSDQPLPQGPGGARRLCQTPQTVARQELRLHARPRAGVIALHGYAAPEVDTSSTACTGAVSAHGRTQSSTPLSWMDCCRCIYVRASSRRPGSWRSNFCAWRSGGCPVLRLVSAHRHLGESCVHRWGVRPLMSTWSKGPPSPPPSYHHSIAELWRAGLATSCLVLVGLGAVVLWGIQIRPGTGPGGVTLAAGTGASLQPDGSVWINALRLHHFCRTVHLRLAVGRDADLWRLANEHGFVQHGEAMDVSPGLAAGPAGAREAGIAQMQQGWPPYRATGANVAPTRIWRLLAEAYGQAGTGRTRGLRCWQRPSYTLRGMGSDGGKPNCIGSRASCCCSRAPQMHVRSRNLLPPGSRHCSPPAGQVPGNCAPTMSLARLWQRRANVPRPTSC